MQRKENSRNKENRNSRISSDFNSGEVLQRQDLPVLVKVWEKEKIRESQKPPISAHFKNFESMFHLYTPWKHQFTGI